MNITGFLYETLVNFTFLKKLTLTSRSTLKRWYLAFSLSNLKSLTYLNLNFDGIECIGRFTDSISELNHLDHLVFHFGSTYREHRIPFYEGLQNLSSLRVPKLSYGPWSSTKGRMKRVQIRRR